MKRILQARKLASRGRRSAGDPLLYIDIVLSKDDRTRHGVRNAGAGSRSEPALPRRALPARPARVRRFPHRRRRRRISGPARPLLDPHRLAGRADEGVELTRLGPRPEMAGFELSTEGGH